MGRRAGYDPAEGSLETGMRVTGKPAAGLGNRARSQARDEQMKRAKKNRTSPLRLGLLALAIGTLAGCEEGSGPSLAQPDATDAAETPKSSGKTTQRDVEAPEVFEVKEAGLWDGRPSLGGIWVAHPDVTQPQRVKIRNTANDKSTIGALFRRERALPGPAVQVSSSAAAALGMLAGAPVEIHVVALRREAIEPTPKAKPAEEKKPEEPAKKADDKSKKPEEPGPNTAEPAEKPQKPAAKGNQETAKAAEEENAQPKRKWWQKSKKNDEITETRLDPIAGAAAAIEAAEVTGGSKAAAASSKPSQGGSITKPYVQIGTFNVEDNAKIAAEKVRKGGLNAEVRSLTNNDKTIWRVIVGPAENRAERKEILAKVEGFGFTDAFVVKN